MREWIEIGPGAKLITVVGCVGLGDEGFPLFDWHAENKRIVKRTNIPVFISTPFQKVERCKEEVADDGGDGSPSIQEAI
jgi:hypothetical protein